MRMEENDKMNFALRGIMILASFAVLLLSWGCASDPTLGYISSIENDSPLDSATLYDKEIKDKGLNLELCLMEKGRISQVCGDFDASKASFDEQIEILRERDINDDTTQKFQINAGSVLVNDRMLPYRARLFETEFLRLYQAYNYLAKGSLEGALVEIRNAEFLMNEAEKARENSEYKDSDFMAFETSVQRKSIFGDEEKAKPEPEKKEEKVPPKSVPATAAPEASKNGEAAPENAEQVQSEDVKKKEEELGSRTEKEYDSQFNQLDTALEKSKSSFLNPYVSFVGALLHDMNGEDNDAYISYKKTCMLMPSNQYVQKKLASLALELAQEQDYEWLKTSFPEAWELAQSKRPDPGKGRLVLFYEDGWVPRKEEVFISMLAVAVAYPIYRFQWSEPLPLTVSVSGNGQYETQPISYANAIVARALKEEAKWRVMRQSARLILKGGVFAAGATMTAASGNSYVQAAGVGIMVASAIYNNMSEKADLRSWMTLPQNVQMLDIESPDGEISLKFSSPSFQGDFEEKVKLEPGKTSILRLVRVGPRLIVQNLWPSKQSSDEIEKAGSASGQNPN